MENNLKKKWKTTSKRNENEDNLKKNQIFSILLNFRGKPFLGLAQLSKIFVMSSQYESHTCWGSAPTPTLNLQRMSNFKEELKLSKQIAL
jgi:hypothetical protein